jgi:hypothetical protein
MFFSIFIFHITKHQHNITICFTMYIYIFIQLKFSLIFIIIIFNGNMYRKKYIIYKYSNYN